MTETAAPEKAAAAVELLPLWAGRVEFTTPYQISQETAQAFWARGDDFTRSGPRTYTWYAKILSPDLPTAIAYLTGEVAEVVAERETFETDGIVFVAGSADRIGEAPRVV
jgi:hypothetical protein